MVIRGLFNIIVAEWRIYMSVTIPSLLQIMVRRLFGTKPLQYIPRNMHTVFALLCFVVVIHWLIFPYPSGLLHWHCGNLTIAPVPAKQPWWIWINTSCEFIMNDCITTTKQSTTKPCAYFLGYTVSEAVLWYHWLGRGWSITSAKCNSTSLTWKAIQLNYRWVKGNKRGLIIHSLYRWDYLSIILIIAGWAWLSKLYLRWNSISRHRWWLITQWLCRCDYSSIVLSHCEFKLVYICQQMSPLRSTRFLNLIALIIKSVYICSDYYSWFPSWQNLNPNPVIMDSAPCHSPPSLVGVPWTSITPTQLGCSPSKIR